MERYQLPQMNLPQLWGTSLRKGCIAFRDAFLLDCLWKKQKDKLDSGKGGKFIHRWKKNTEDTHYYKNIMPLAHLNKRENENMKLRKVSFPHRQLKFSYSVFKRTRLFLRSQSQALPMDGGWKLNDL